ncbi:MAG TPA: NAD-dependent epimerase/dehydratase family protein, partial [Spirochaetia bacterium]|nr:NAD-dependent epimerase/dehydratase family protein [Spirochaetia bacterium]
MKGNAMKIFLTGGTGFIGSFVARELAARGHTLHILARNTDKVPALRQLPGVNIFQAQLTDYDLIRPRLSGMEAVVHVALGWGDTPVD